MKPTRDTKMLASGLVCGIPLIGLILILSLGNVEITNLIVIAIALIMVFPIVIVANILRAKKY